MSQYLYPSRKFYRRKFYQAEIMVALILSLLHLLLQEHTTAATVPAHLSQDSFRMHESPISKTSRPAAGQEELPAVQQQ